MNRDIARHMTIMLGALSLAVGIGACAAQPAVPAAPAAPATVAPAAAVAAEAVAPPAVAMAETPQLITPQQYQDQFAAPEAGHQLIDVRTPEEFESGHIAGSTNIPVESLEQRIGEVSRATPVVVYCRSGRRSAQAAQILDGAGYTGVYDLGGIQAWQAAGFPVE